MASGKQSLWEDGPLVRRVVEARRCLARVFGLDRFSTHGDWTDVVNRILAGKLSDKERRAAERLNAIAPDFHEDVVQLNQLPRAFDELDDRLHADFRPTLVEWARGALNNRADNPECLAFVVSSVHRHLLWLIIQNSQELLARSQGGNWLDWLHARAKTAIDRYANPSPLFGNFDLLRRVGEAWVLYKGKLCLTAAEQGINRENLREARVNLARQRQGADQQLHGGEAPKGTPPKDPDPVPWPPAVAEMLALLMDPEKTPELHAVLHGCVDREINGRSADARKSRDEAALWKHEAQLEFLDMIAFRIIKNARYYDETTPDGATTWAPRVFTYLTKDAWKAVNYAEGRTAEGVEREPMVSLDSASGNIVCPRSKSEQERLELLDAIRALPDHLRRPLCLKFGLDPDKLERCEEKSTAEIAKQLGTTEKSVKQRIRRALEILRSKLGADVS